MFEEIVIQSETIRLSGCCYLSLLVGTDLKSHCNNHFPFVFRWPFTRLFADPAKFCQEKNYTEKGVSTSLAGAAMSNN